MTEDTKDEGYVCVEYLANTGATSTTIEDTKYESCDYCHSEGGLAFEDTGDGYGFGACDGYGYGDGEGENIGYGYGDGIGNYND